ncbi:MAG: hypothetical protein M1829_001027 [Trizodia sp. TS-e1964]|nr:MAG: hypothetical protein M1829_001027 [Trizodia sp. TS-e1964]
MYSRRLVRYLRLIVNCVSHWTFKPIPLSNEPTLTSNDVTVIIPTIDGKGDELIDTVRSVLAACPFEVILVTPDEHVELLCKVANKIHSKIKVLGVSRPNKRVQLCRAIPEVRTKITILADDDVVWPIKLLQWVLAPFERPEIGGVGTSQRLRREERPNVWSFLAALYLERRNFDISSTIHLDGGISCLSGRTAAYRTSILKDANFIYDFQNELWLRRYHLNTDDDNFITRWMLSHRWKIHVQYCKEAEVQTTLEYSPRFLKQCLRWSRSNWRSNLTSMVVERHIWSQQPWSSYAVHLATLSPPALVSDFFLLYLCYQATSDWSPDLQLWACGCLAMWIFITKFIKVLGHYIRYPADILYLPISILFGWLHGFIKIYAFLTLHVTSWGTRNLTEADESQQPLFAVQEQEKQAHRYL